MSFERHNGAVQEAPGADPVKAWLKVRRGGAVRMTMTVAGKMAANFAALASGAEARCAVYVGTGDDAGRLQLQFAEDGDVVVRLLGKDVRRLTFGAPAGVPRGDRTTATCRVVERGADHITVELPLREWGAQALVPAPPAALPPPAPAVKAPIKASGKEPGYGEHKLDAVRYLTKKGVAIEQLPTGEYAIGSVLAADVDVVRLINKHRKDSDLMPITATDLA